VPTDYYAELGVSRSASADEIRKVYRKLAVELHPDRNQGDAKNEARFKRGNEAYHVLTDAKKRKLYDEFGEMGLREGFDPNMARGFGRQGGMGGGGFEDLFRNAGGGGGGAGIGDIFGDLFGGGGGRGRRRARRAPDLESEITIEFVSAVRGAELELSIQGRPVKVRIPKGAQEGDKLRVKGAGGIAGPGVPPSDLVLTVRVKGHPHFQREGLDLTVEVPITPGEAYFGAKIEVPTTTGTVQLKVPPHSQSGQLLRLRDKGAARGKNTGDLYVRFLIQLPKAEDDALKEAIKTLEEASAEDLRADVKF
jgi:curved DNA-binding protein